MSITGAKVDARYILNTPPTPGAIAIVQLHGTACTDVLRAMTGVPDWPIGQLRLVNLSDIDEGLAGRITEEVVQIMPHGGPRVIQRLLKRLRDVGACPMDATASPIESYPEADDEYEAIALAAVARAASPLAIDPLLLQPAIWRSPMTLTDVDRARSLTLNRLLTPATVVVAGAPNVGKSTLSNALVGRCISISLDMPGTTRDFTAAHIDLAGLVVHWHDTPGLRDSSDRIEAQAIDLASRLMDAADLLIALADWEHEWPQLPRQPDLRIANKSDVSTRSDADLNISAVNGEGIDALVSLVRDTLLPPEHLEAAHQRPWLFDARLLETQKHAAGEDLSGFLPRRT